MLHTFLVPYPSSLCPSPRHVVLAIKNDEELAKVTDRVDISQGGRDQKSASVQAPVCLKVDVQTCVCIIQVSFPCESGGLDSLLCSRSLP